MSAYQVELKDEREFSCRLIRPDTWLINGGPVSCTTYLVIGDQQALVIDPGEHTKSIRDYAAHLTDKPFVVANTHSHNDHTLANGQFKDCTIYASALAQKEKEESRKRFPLGYEPERYTTPVEFDFDYQFTTLSDGDVLDLGNRRLRVIAAGCHSEGSLLYYDEKYEILFTGDELDCGQVLIQGDRGNQSVELFYGNLKKIKAACGRIDLICPGHNGAPADGSMVDAFIENCERIMSGIEGSKKISSASYLTPDDPRGPERVKQLLSDPNSRRSEWKGSSIVYSLNKIRKQQQE